MQNDSVSPSRREPLGPLLARLVALVGVAVPGCYPPTAPALLGRGHCSEGYAAEIVDADIDDVDDGDGVLSDEECWDLCLASADISESVREELTDGYALDSGIYRVKDGCRVIEGPPHTVRCQVYLENCFAGGRGHRCVLPNPAPESPGTAAWFAQMAYAEAGSVVAFELLERELSAHGLTAALRARIREAADDERRHATAMRRLAAQHGACVRPLTLRSAPEPRSLLDIALENAVEGCVRESWGALEARYQSRRAPSAELRVALSRIADDEARHAELAWAIHDWALSRLSPAAGACVVAALEAAIASHASALVVEREPELIASVGLPDAATTRALWQHLTVSGALRAVT